MWYPEQAVRRGFAALSTCAQIAQANLCFNLKIAKHFLLFYLQFIINGVAYREACS